MPDAELK